MKIEKGYTLSQFIGLLKKDNQTYGDWARNYALIVRYDEFYNKPLTKEMFVNEIKEPIDVCFNESDEISFGIDWNNYIDAETKVIFKKVENINESKFANYILCSNYQLIFHSDYVTLVKLSETDRLPITLGQIKTIGDLFQLTNGDIEIQNVEL